jgi:GNAT superfamily N-acetyltransferase
MAVKNSRSVEEAKKVIREAGLYIVKESDYERILNVAADYYEEDALVTWLCGGKFRREVFMNIVRAAIYAMPDTFIYADSDEFNALAIWNAPGFSGINVPNYLKKGGYDLLKLGGISLIFRLFIYNSYATKLRKRQTGGKDWYLFVYTVRTISQGQGYGEKMLKPITEFAWKRGEACYSEVNNDIGIAIMKQAGFQVREQGKVPGSNVNHYGLIV